jgi:hypothetical protein
MATRNLLGDFPNQADTIFVLFTKTQDATTTNADAGCPNGIYGCKSIIIRAGSNYLPCRKHVTLKCASCADLGIELSAGIQIMVIGGEPRFFELLRLFGR